jgi:hypothetical protein
MTLLEIKKALRNGQYAWPGGYPLFFIMNDGAAISFDALRSNWQHVVSDHLGKYDTGWTVADVAINWEDEELFCDATGALIECAYPSDD